MKKKNIAKSLFLCLFSILLISNDVSNYDLKAETNKLDFSRPNSIDSNVVKGEELFSLIYGYSDLSELEKEYLEKSNFEFKYDSKIPFDRVYTLLNEDELIVHASEYSYESINGVSVTWTPSFASLNDEKVFFSFDSSENEYICNFTNVLEEDEKIDITYTTQLTLDKNTVIEFSNYTYNIADGYVKDDIVGKTNKTNEENTKKYNEELALYNQYLKDKDQFDKDTIAYANYLAEKDSYDANLKKYNDYLVRLEEHNKSVEKYDNYLKQVEAYKKYQSYLKEKEKYDAAYAEYLEEYNKNKDTYAKIDYYFAVMDQVKEENTSLNRSLYNAIMGGTVTEVLARRDELTELNVSEALIDKAETATYNLREIFNSYYSKDNDEAKFIYYKANYRSIRDNFINLLQALDSLYKYDIVQLAVDVKEKKPQFLILLSQLVMICNAISYEPVKDTNGVVYTTSTKFGGKTVMENLENDYDFVEDDNLAYPSRSVLYMERPIAPTPIEVVEKVENPVVVEEPGAAPTVVANPGEAPAVVEKPTKPKLVLEPTKPEMIKVDEKIMELINAYNNQALTPRIEPTDYDLDLTSNFSKKFRNISTVAVEFYDLDNSFIYRALAEKDGPIYYEGIIPTKPADNVYSEYTFSHWEYEDGEKLDLNSVSKDGFVYPKFVGTKLQTYDVTWIVDGNTIIETYEYGETPSFSGDLEKPTDGYYYYTFSSWDKEIESVTQNETYTAIFDKHDLIPVEDESVGITYIEKDNLIILDATMFDVEDVDLSDFFNKIIDLENQYSIIINSSNFYVELPKSVVSQFKLNNFKNIDLELTEQENKEYTITFKAFDMNNNVILTNLEAELVISGKFNAYKESSIYLINEDGSETLISEAVITKKNITFSAKSGQTFKMYPMYTIITPDEGEDYVFGVEKKKYKIGELVTFDLQINEEVESYELLIIDAKGNSISYENNTFIMPASNVRINVRNIVYKEPVILVYYTISFVVDGVVISEKKYLEGSEVIPPADIAKVSDENYSYTFVGWDKEVTNAIADVEYHAVFEATPVVRPTPPAPKVNIVKVVKAIAIAGVSIIGVTITLVILFKKKILTKAKIKAFFGKIKAKIIKIIGKKH